MAVPSNLFAQLQAAEPVEPRGWFRWLHNHFAGRYPCYDPRFEEPLASQGWRDCQDFLPEFPREDIEVLLPILRRHAWTVGYLGLKELADACWKRLERPERGAVLAGFTERHPDAGDVEWMRGHLAAAALGPESLCQIACNAIRYKWPDVLVMVLESGASLGATIHRGDDGQYPISCWPEILQKLSHRVIDMILEAAIIMQVPDAVRLALRKGGNPDVPIWKLERSYNEKHCALSFAISEGCRDTAEMLLEAGASGQGTEFTAPNYPVYLAISNGWDDFAAQLLEHGASLRQPEITTPISIKMEGSESQVILPGARGPFFGHFAEELNWARQSVGNLIPLARIAEKPSFYRGNGQGGYHTTIVNSIVGDVERLKRYEALGLDTRLTPEELCTAIDGDAFDGLVYLLGKHGEEKRDRVLFRIRHRKPDFGAVCREIETLPQAEGINVATDFNPGDQPPLVLANGEKLFVDLDAIAPSVHSHGPCLEGHFWLQVEDPNYRRRQGRVFLTELRRRWAITKLHQNRHQLDDLLPCIKETNGQYIRLGVTLGKLFYRVRNSDTKDRIHQWFKSPEFQCVLDEAERRIREQDAANRRPRKPVLSEDELNGYPTVFWPYLVRLPSGYLGMTPESCSDDPGKLDLYEVWARQNKTEDVFVPDPRLLFWEGWKDVPIEYRPFFHIDPLFDRPGVRDKAANAYEEAMIQKAVMWWNAWMTPRVLNEIEKHQHGGAEREED